MLRPQGYMRVIDAEGRVTETDTFTCKHCRKVHEVQPGIAVDYDFCRNCMAPICPNCAGKPCKHFEKALEEAEARGRMIRDIDYLSGA